MADDIPPVRGEAFTFYVTLVSQANTKIFQAAPTLAVGDAKVSIDGGALDNITTPPDVMPAGSKQVRVQLSGLETNGAKIGVLFSDAAGSEWCDGYWEFLTGPRQIGDLATTGADGDTLETLSGQLDLVALTGADADTLETLSDQLDVAQADLDSPDQYKANVSLLAIEGNVEGHVTASLTTYDPPTSAEATADKVEIIAEVDANEVKIDAIGLKTINLPVDPADESLLEAAIAASESSIRGVDNDTLKTLSDQVDGIVAAVWVAGSRTLTSFGTLVADIWAAGTRTLTSFGTLTTDTAAAVWAYATRTLTSFGTLIASIWSYVTRTLTQSGIQVAAVVSGSDISLKSYTTWTINLTGIGNLADRTKLYFTAKRDLEDDPDTASDLQIVESKPAAAGDGLLYINRAAALAASKGSIVVTDEVVGNLTVTVDASVTGIGKRSVSYGVKKVTATAVQAMVEGVFEVDAPTARATT